MLSRLSLGGLLMLATAAPALSQGAPSSLGQPSPREPVVRVSAEGEASVAPDTAIVSFSVVRNSETAEVAVGENGTAMAAVTAALKAEGIEARDLQTSNFSIYPQYRQSEPQDGVVEPPQVVGYEVTNTLTVKIRDIAKVGAILDRSVKLGVNQGGQITFTNDDPEAALAEARKQAVEKGMAKARALTEAAGVKLGPVIEISEGGNQQTPPQPIYRMAMAKEASDGVPVAAGENTYIVTINLTFGIEQ
ncbi:SIMPL domain-containing protein [Hyphomonas sp.]|uniref:SIMPL domain-containing protein n=1 Tax=Hyphomonas sp. TaxID=87 RepID=UPI003919EC41